MDEKDKIPGIPGNSNVVVAEHSAVQVKLPPFWTNSPATWFIQAESQFVLSRVVNDVKKYHYVISSLPQEVADSIHDVLENPPLVDMYGSIKKTLIDRNSLSVEKRIRILISDEEMGDRTPSEFYRYLKLLAGPCANLGEELIRKIWKSRLPHLVNISLIQGGEQQPLNKILEVADQVYEAMQTANISSISSSEGHLTAPSRASEYSESSRIGNLEKQISELKSMVSNLSVRKGRSHSKPRHSRDSSRPRSLNRKFNEENRLCWYHFRFGNKAQKCVSPCAESSSFRKPSSTN